ncbi:TetR/AcrR family transcriptional regulator [Homoserinimonas sp. OAct 916]|uniref:TetR/AcrR family transcriptional regulator n=1 Tax=Homoserinimonas sp. OAct 916 TaxID=2211450 RepID=UPI000DBE297F|nr:TetR/AcrR family transcriptional regulator [Homoserinimonas sp. OAct 916]
MSHPASPAPRSAPGRPRSSSKEMLEDAANELFLENGYAGTTIEQITTRAGVSRNTFFNYFQAKSDVFWVHVDDRLATLDDALNGIPDEIPLMKALADGIAALGHQFGPSEVPWALTQYDVIGDVAELQASALSRVMRIARILAEFIASRLTSGAAEAQNRAQSLAYAVTGAMIAGAQAWAAAGTGRGSLAPFLTAAVAPICAGFQHTGLEHDDTGPASHGSATT